MIFLSGDLILAKCIFFSAFYSTFKMKHFFLKEIFIFIVNVGHSDPYIFYSLENKRVFNAMYGDS